MNAQTHLSTFIENNSVPTLHVFNHKEGSPTSKHDKNMI